MFPRLRRMPSALLGASTIERVALRLSGAQGRVVQLIIKIAGAIWEGRPVQTAPFPTTDDGPRPAIEALATLRQTVG